MINNSKNSFLSFLAKASFFFFLFFMIFGTSLPFRDVRGEAADVYEVATSNVVNQIVYTLLFLSSSFTLLFKRKELVTVIRREKFLTLFLLWCLLSVFWSAVPFVSFKRLFQIITAYTVSIAFFLHIDSSEEIIKYFKVILSVYILITLPSILIS